MKLPAVQKILREDIKDPPTWLGTITDPINNFMQIVYQCLSKNVSLQDNIACQVKEFTYITPSTYPTMDNISFPSTLKTKAIGLISMQIVNKSTHSPIMISTHIPWTEENGQIIIYPIVGLAASTTYTVRVVIF